MRFFTTLEEAGRLEFFLVRVVLAIATLVLVYGVLDFRLIDTTLLGDDASFTDMFSYSQALFPVFLIGMTIVFFFTVINACRRLKDIGKSFTLALLLFIPLVGSVFELFLLFARGDAGKTYAPYGDNPYDPQSWIAPPNPNGGPAVSYRGEDLHLPGEGFAASEQPPAPGEQAA